MEFYSVDRKDANELGKSGWETFPLTATGGELILYKEVYVPLDDPLNKALVGFYENPRWRKTVGWSNASDSRLSYYRGIGIAFERRPDPETGKKKWKLRIEGNENLVETLTTWRVQIWLDGPNAGSLCLAPQDITYPYVIAKAEELDAHAPGIVAELSESGLLRKVSDA